MKKTVKTIIKILLILIILWLIAFGIDYYRCSNLKEPIFVIQSIQDQLGTFDGSEMFSCHCLGYKVYYSRIRKTSELYKYVYIE